MALLNVALPVVQVLLEIFRDRQGEIAKDAGVSKDVVGRIGQMMEGYLTQDERVNQQVYAEIEKARQHDAATQDRSDPIVNLLRGIVRPVITLTAFLWYVLARAQGVELNAEDYAIIGGILAFWFGFRPFEKTPKR